MAKYGIYALALEAGGRQARVVSSNPGHALWCGIADPDKGRRTADRLTRDDMFSGWGIRTLSTRARRYNPIGYHLGTVWPHDNALIAAGFRRYGCDDHLRTLFTSMVQAAERFTAFRLPEVFSGLSRAEYGVPVSYPVACHPQAWAAGAVPFMLQSALGLQPNALEGRLTIVRPVLPDPVSWVEVRRLRVGGDRVDLRFQRERSGDITVDVLNRPRRVEVVVERRPAPGDREASEESRDLSIGAPTRRHEGEKRIA
jgi:glycogen debranching enzyme